MEQQQLAPDVVSYGATISACEKGGKWQEALGLLDWMLQIRLLPSDICRFNAAISACEKTGHWEQALALLRALRNAAPSAEVITFNAAISACEKLVLHQPSPVW
ncbi:EMB2654 [Symbiodinium pilosum]|uniref:EMB2654 protein n=1 Tax=Symbiodinium pilosum TaxID=2952 RepID=A0A812WHR5_SYMPI|nr:EMB2654 [Symbiodinium pilosum]